MSDLAAPVDSHGVEQRLHKVRASLRAHGAPLELLDSSLLEETNGVVQWTLAWLEAIEPERSPQAIIWSLNELAHQSRRLGHLYPGHRSGAHGSIGFSKVRASRRFRRPARCSTIRNQIRRFSQMRVSSPENTDQFPTDALENLS